VLTRRFPGMAPDDFVSTRLPVFRLPASGCQWRASFTFTVQQCGCSYVNTERWTSCHAHELVLHLDPRLWPSSYCDGQSSRMCCVAGYSVDIPVLKAVSMGGPRLWLFKHLVDTFVAHKSRNATRVIGAGIPEERSRRWHMEWTSTGFVPSAPAQRALCRESWASTTGTSCWCSRGSSLKKVLTPCLLPGLS